MKRVKKRQTSVWDLWNIAKLTNVYVHEGPEGAEIKG
jgi:hypothetical protein